VNILGILEPTIEMHIESLIKACEAPEKDIIKVAILGVAAFKPNKKQLKEVLQLACFPVSSDGVLTWKKASADFAIIDRREYGKLFVDKISLLDFTLEEVHQMQFFLEPLDLFKNRLSLMVKEKTEAKDGVLEHNITRNFQKKAYAICRYDSDCFRHLSTTNKRSRYVVHNRNSQADQNPRAIFEQLKTAQVYITDSISNVLTVTQNEKLVPVPLESGYVHIEEVESTLRVYVPKSRKLRDFAFSQALPSNLLKHFKCSINGLDGTLGLILRAGSLFEVNKLLDGAGIITLSEIDTPESDSESSSDTESELAVENELEFQLHSTSEQRSDETLVGEPEDQLENESETNISEHVSATTPASSILQFHEASTVSSARLHDVELSIRGRVATSAGGEDSIEEDTSFIEPVSTLRGTEDRSNAYRQLLETVINGAKSLEKLPSKGECAFSVYKPSTFVSVDIGAALGSPVPRGHLKKLGAAGELFTFELLRKLLHPEFSELNWQSKIRHLVSVHPDYQWLTRWNTEEPSDIVHDDTLGKFTNLLIESQYLDREVWIGQKPKYYIEVKSTTLEMEHPLYVSQPQFDRMSRYALRSGQASARVYIIVRVFGIGHGGKMGVRLYVDPAPRVGGELKVTTYIMTPMT
jgi:hypothetical protein